MIAPALALSLVSALPASPLSKVQLSEPAAVWAAAVAVGQGLRFNNPYRLSRTLGRTAESLSLAAPYGSVLGRVSWAGGLASRHGFQVSVDVAVAGISQWVLVPSYWLLLEGKGAWNATVRVGLPVSISPDTNLASEAAAGLRWEMWPDIFAHVEVIGSLFVGAAIPERSFSLYPLLSLQSGVSYRFGQGQ